VQNPRFFLIRTNAGVAVYLISGFTMTNLKLNKIAKLGGTVVIGLTALGMGACSTTSGTMSAQGAPITYKVDQGNVQQASLTAPYSSVLPTQPQMAARPAPAQPLARPMASVPMRPVAKPQPQLPRLGAPKFDMKTVDTDLYAHQRIGKPYTIMGKRYTPKHQPKYDKIGTASWYGPKFHGKLTANGETYDMDGITAAHKTLPLNSMVMVTNVESGKSMKVRINDRGPFVGDRIIDLSRAVANDLGLFNSGLGKVRVQYAGPADPNATDSKPVSLPKALERPRLKPAPAPEVVAEAPQAQAPKYRPLRDLGRDLSRNLSKAIPAPAPIAQPLQQQVQPRFPFEPKMNLPQPSVPQTSIPQAVIPQPSLPQAAPQNVEVPAAPTGNLEDGPVTLTIKGPIHMASDKNDGSTERAQFIPAVNYTTLPAEK